MIFVVPSRSHGLIEGDDTGVRAQPCEPCRSERYSAGLELRRSGCSLVVNSVRLCLSLIGRIIVVRIQLRYFIVLSRPQKDSTGVKILTLRWRCERSLPYMSYGKLSRDIVQSIDLLFSSSLLAI